MATFKFRNLKNGHATSIPSGEFTVGRAEDAYVHIDDASISRHHARLLNTGPDFFVEDLGSANGIALNGAYVKGRSKIVLGDLIHIGSVPFRLDPEVAGEASTPHSAGLQRVDRAQLRKETAKISVKEAPSEKEKFSSGPLIRQSVPLPTLVKLMEPPPTGKPVDQPAEQPAAPETALSYATAMAESPVPEPAEIGLETATPWWWWLAIFMAGLGTGLVLALSFVRFFLEMGGKMSSLP